jgi:hypothetical protein
VKGKPFKYRKAVPSDTGFPGHIHGKRSFALKLVARGKRLRKRIRVVVSGLVALGVLSAVFE